MVAAIGIPGSDGEAAVEFRTYSYAIDLMTELRTGEKITLQKGRMYIVTDQQSSHRSHGANGARLLSIDGDFLRSMKLQINQL